MLRFKEKAEIERNPVRPVSNPFRKQGPTWLINVQNKEVITPRASLLFEIQSALFPLRYGREVVRYGSRNGGTALPTTVHYDYLRFCAPRASSALLYYRVQEGACGNPRSIFPGICVRGAFLT